MENEKEIPVLVQKKIGEQITTVERPGLFGNKKFIVTNEVIVDVQNLDNPEVAAERKKAAVKTASSVLAGIFLAGAASKAGELSTEAVVAVTKWSFRKVGEGITSLGSKMVQMTQKGDEPQSEAEKEKIREEIRLEKIETLNTALEEEKGKEKPSESKIKKIQNELEKLQS